MVEICFVQLFYHAHIEPTFLLDKDESRHLVRVLRKTVGDQVVFTDGRGRFYTCEIVVASDKKASLKVVSQQEQPARKSQLTVAIAPTKNMDRLEWFVEKAVEIGIERIVPILCEHSERKVIKIDRLERIAISGMKQSLKARIPQVSELMPFNEFVANDASTHKVLCHLPQNGESLDLRNLEVRGDVTVLIGPEGDFAPVEIRSALDAGFVNHTLGEQRLRTETAGLVAVSHLAYLIDKMNV